MIRLLALSLFTLASSYAVVSNAGDAPKTFGTIDRRDPAFDAIIPKDAKIEKLADGFKWTEGPVWIAEKNYLLFSDIPNNAIHKWDPATKTLTRDFIKPSGYTGPMPPPMYEPGSNGLTTDREGRLVLCEHGDRCVTRIEKDGKKTVLADKFGGKRFNSPNDLVYDSKGNLYFTDPPYGLEKAANDPLRQLDYCGIYRLGADGKISLLTKEMSFPNGIALSPDEKTLYVANSDPFKAIWNKFPVNADGTLGKAELFHDSTALVGKKPGLPDGMKVDVNGNLFATGPGGVYVFDPSGKVLGVLDTGVPTANCAAFGDDGSTLYIAADKSLAKIRTNTKGLKFKK